MELGPRPRWRDLLLVNVNHHEVIPSSCTKSPWSGYSRAEKTMDFKRDHSLIWDGKGQIRPAGRLPDG